MTKIASDSEQFAIVTNIGKTKLNQLAAGQRLVITALALGDGNGTSVIPNADGKSLTHEIGREAITDQSSDYLAAGVFMSSAMSAKYQGQWLREVGLIDSEGDLIVWGALASTLVSALTERTIMVHLPLSDVDHITVVVDTAKKFASIDDVSQAMIQHAKKDNPHEQYTTHGELNAAIKSVESKIPHAATHDEVAQGVNDKNFVTPETLNKKGLIQQLQDYATQAADKVKEDIYGGVPAVTLDTIKEVADALSQTGDATKSILAKLGSLTATADDNKNAINNHQESRAAHTPEQVGAAPVVHGHTPEEVGAAPAAHTHAPEQVGAAPVAHGHAPEQVGAAPVVHGHTPEQVGAAPVVHGHTPEQVGAAPAVHTHAPAQVGAAPAVHGHTPEQVGAAPAGHTHAPAQVGAAPAAHTHAPEQVGAAPAAHTHTPAQVGAAPAVHGHTPEQVGAAPAAHTHAPAQVGAAPAAHSHDWASIGQKPAFLTAADKMMTRRWRKTLYEEYTGSSHTSYDSGEVNNDSGCEMMVSIIAWASNHTPRASINVSTGSGSEYCKIASDIIQGTTAMATCVATIPANTTYRIKVVSRITEISTLKYWG